MSEGVPIRSTARDEERIPGPRLDLAPLRPAEDAPVQRARAGALSLWLSEQTTTWSTGVQVR